MVRQSRLPPITVSTYSKSFNRVEPEGTPPKKKKYDCRSKYLLFLKMVNLSNNLKMTDNGGWLFSAYVGPGNNSFVVKSAIRRRGWWRLEEEITAGTNLVWTQRLSSFHEAMKPSKNEQSFVHCELSLDEEGRLEGD